jgi:hypothetical protein
MADTLVRTFDSSEAGFASGWSADILVRSVPELNTEANKNVRAPKHRRCAWYVSRITVKIAEPSGLPDDAGLCLVSSYPRIRNAHGIPNSP